MATIDIKLRVHLAWWVLPIIRVLIVIAHITRHVPSEDTVRRIVMRGVRATSRSV